MTDVLDSNGITLLAIPNVRASKFLDWFTYSESTIDGQNRKKAYTLFESGILDSIKLGTYHGHSAFTFRTRIIPVTQ